MNRVFHIAGIAWMLASLAVLGCGWPAIVIGGIALLFLLAYKRLPLWMRSAAAAVFFCALVLICAQSGMPDRRQYNGTTQLVHGVVTDLDLSGRSFILRLNQENPAGLKNARLRVYSRTGVEESIGDVVEYSLKLEGFGEISWMAQDLDFTAFGGASRLLGHASTLETRLSLLRSKMAGNLQRMLPKEDGALLSAVLLGRTGTLPDRLRQIYTEAGLSHLLSVSGLHLSVLLSLFGLCLQQSWLPRNSRLCLEIGLAVSFAVMTGLSPSIFRAALMLFLHRLALLLGRDADSLNSLGISVIIILLFNPYSVFSLSLQLSYLATMGISAFAEPMAGAFGERLREEHPRLFSLFSMFCVTLSAQILTVPLVCWQFGQLALLTPVSNLLASLPASLMLALGIVTVVLSLIPMLSSLCRLAALGAGLSAHLITWIASLTGFSVPIQNDYVIIWLAGSIGLFLLLWYLGAKWNHFLWAAEWSACTIAAVSCLHLIFWGHPVIICAPQYGDSVLLIHREQAVLIGSPEQEKESERLAALMKGLQVKELSLFLPETTPGEAFLPLADDFPPLQVIPLDTCNGFQGMVFGHMLLEQENDSIRMKINGLELVKTFDMVSVDAHILINGRNEIIAAPEQPVTQNSRYYGCTQLFLPMPKEESNEV
ncbi:MAG: ComEC family competence protein [Oscillospiraceae bacterium]|nr:ComEC family competence protein [Oscillospiraceae bacterium]